MQTAFVTGASGFIGGALTRRLVADGWRVRALARSDASAATVAGRGAEAVRGDLQDAGAIADGARGCDVAFHCAAMLGDWGTREAFEAGNVAGTANVLQAARRAGVRRVVHVGTEAALLDGHPLVQVDESAPLRPDSPALYSATKARAEQAVLAAAGPDLETVVVRPRLVWGPGDTTILPQLEAAVQAGRFAWIGGGRHLTSTTHVDNAVEGLVLGAERGASGQAYFVTDGEPVVFRDFITRLLATAGVVAPGRSVPAPVARAVAVTSEALWRTLPLRGHPPLTRLAVWLSSLETTIDISKARAELAYAPVITVDEGLRRMQEAA
ncbi:MAG TPA: NAD-dependent epimerase/dehydratase family protein [Solirubrobacteraceae bacterium]|nr:NAD-dependent epimerase/dehydratase family protein [Solirubrobacteraceae bacterium]